MRGGRLNEENFKFNSNCNLSNLNSMFLNCVFRWGNPCIDKTNIWWTVSVGFLWAYCSCHFDLTEGISWRSIGYVFRHVVVQLRQQNAGLYLCISLIFSSTHHEALCAFVPLFSSSANHSHQTLNVRQAGQGTMVWLSFFFSLISNIHFSSASSNQNNYRRGCKWTLWVKIHLTCWARNEKTLCGRRNNSPLSVCVMD